MVNNLKTIISKFWPFALLILLLPAYWFYEYGRKQFTVKNGDFVSELDEFLTQLSKRWQLGDIEGAWKQGNLTCADIPGNVEFIDSEFLKCNAHYLKCFFRQQEKSGKASIETKRFKFHADLTSMARLSGGDLKISFSEEKTKQQFSVRLEHNCHDTYLPQAVYSVGPEPRSELVWDNFGRDIFVDKNYVSYWDVWYFTDRPIPKTKKFYQPVMDFTPEQMHKYCQSLGKKLLDARVLDAASFYPTQFKQGYMFKSFYPWGKSRHIIKDEEINEKTCARFFTKECLQKYGQAAWFKTRTPGWTGVYYVLGGYMEYLENVMEEDRNVMVSNLNLDRASKWHRLGLRSKWQEKDRVAFRCMRIK